jgi:ribonuclease-3
VNARAEAVEALQRRLGHAFTDKGLLERALTHSSVAPDARNKRRDNERLEFLGDRVLGLLVAEHLIEAFPDAVEGELSPRLHMLVDRNACARVARRIDLGPALRLAPGETRNGGREHDTILSDACEAVIAALYLDGGLDRVRAVWKDIWGEELAAPAEPRVHNPKSALQEWAAAKGRPPPAYTVVGREGPDHAPRFTVEARIEGLEPVRAEGTSRQGAEKAAAQALLSREGVV